MTESNTKKVVAFGEVLWDCLPSGLFLGGAPLNVAYHASRLGATSYLASAVGKDFLGDEVVRRFEASGVQTDLLKRHPRWPTGASVASLDKSGDATYEILEKVAWDEIALEEEDSPILASADAFVFGSLAARTESNRSLLLGLLERTEALKVCDVNLRAPHDDLDLALSLLKRSDVIKVNDEELRRLVGGDEGEFLDCIKALNQKTGVDLICVTLGSKGAMLWRRGRFFSLPPDDISVADTIGAGDAFTAALTMGLLEKRGLEECLVRALKLSSFVASKRGAQPLYKPRKLFS
ncbi:carbohydrate kinase [Pelagicoccus sp. NFK12]|uniref:Carbohydrate kinase n=1 Tax=Pelagicoccus enzymogenes TaxID=2773457 RepID=A0A927F7E4_9BACT|nr:carbohydrate kinase [Pelagicoccus enzymogenes]MBD5779096.1 carbohydrate kinase [Pelagicoccus enzymogenes]